VRVWQVLRCEYFCKNERQAEKMGKTAQRVQVSGG